MLRDKSILESFDLVEELDDKSAALYSGGRLTRSWRLQPIGGEPVSSKREIAASALSLADSVTVIGDALAEAESLAIGNSAVAVSRARAQSSLGSATATAKSTAIAI